MDPRLLDYFNEELAFMRESAVEFAARHPKVAARLGLREGAVDDPFVERLIEAFCLLSARTRIKLDAEFPRFTQRLLDIVYPQHLAPLPAMGVASLQPDPGAADLGRGAWLPRGSALLGRAAAETATACEFRTALAVRLWPLQVAEAWLGAPPAQALDVARNLGAQKPVRACLRLRLVTLGNWTFEDLDGLDDLRLHVCGADAVASQLVELLLATALGCAVVAPRDDGRVLHGTGPEAVTAEGFEPEQGLLPLPWNGRHAPNLLREYFACPARFNFVGLRQLGPGFAALSGREAEVWVLLAGEAGKLGAVVDHGRFDLFCTPVINLLHRRCDVLDVSGSQAEIHVVPDRSRPLDFEVFSLDELRAPGRGGSATWSKPLVFRPLYQSLIGDAAQDQRRYFCERREPRLPSLTARSGARSDYVGTEVFVSLVDQQQAPYADDLSELAVEAWLSNRDLPLLMPRDGHWDLRPVQAAPLAGVRLRGALSAPRPAPTADASAWELVRLLALHHVTLAGLQPSQAAAVLREALRLFATGRSEGLLQAEALREARMRCTTRRLPGPGPAVFGHALECELEFDELGFSGASPYVLGGILDRWLAEQAAQNACTQTFLASVQRGRLATWPLRLGGRELA